MTKSKVLLKSLSGAQSFVWLFPWEMLPKVRWHNAVKLKIDGEWWPSSGPFSLSGKMSYGQMSWSIKISRLDVSMIVSYWHLTGISAALLPRPLKSLNPNISASLHLKCDLRLVAILAMWSWLVVIVIHDIPPNLILTHWPQWYVLTLYMLHFSDGTYICIVCQYYILIWHRYLKFYFM